jgi:hypothetical protein
MHRPAQNAEIARDPSNQRASDCRTRLGRAADQSAPASPKPWMVSALQPSQSALQASAARRDMSQALRSAWADRPRSRSAYRPRILDLHHICAEIGQQLRRPRAGDHPAQIQHPDMTKSRWADRCRPGLRHCLTCCRHRLKPIAWSDASQGSKEERWLRLGPISGVASL